MALPTVPTAVLNAVAPHELGKASGINYMMQRFGAVFAIAIGGAVFAAYGHLGTPANATDTATSPRSPPAPRSRSWPHSARSPSPDQPARAARDLESSVTAAA